MALLVLRFRILVLLFYRLHDVEMVNIVMLASRYQLLMVRDRLLNYTPPAVVIRLLATNGILAYSTSWILFLSGASSDPRLLLPAWASITLVRQRSFTTFFRIPDTR